MGSLENLEKTIVRCTRCPELRGYCAQVAAEKKRAYRDWTYWGKPVPAFGDPRARVMLVGLAPGAHGSNRTGRMFTGDASGDFLYPALYRAGFAAQSSSLRRGDGLRLHDCFITAALRCAPPGNKPTPAQLRRCYPYLLAEFAALPFTQVVIGLGSIGTNAALRMLADSGFSVNKTAWKFAHGAELRATAPGREIALISSFHPSRQNTNTGKLTVPMFDAIFARAAVLVR